MILTCLSIFIPINGRARPPKPYINMFVPSSFETDEAGRYLTPRSDNGIRSGIMIALNITADKTALHGVDRCIMFSMLSCGYVTANIAGIMAKYLATSVAILNVVKCTPCN